MRYPKPNVAKIKVFPQKFLNRRCNFPCKQCQGTQFFNLLSITAGVKRFQDRFPFARRYDKHILSIGAKAWPP